MKVIYVILISWCCCSIAMDKPNATNIQQQPTQTIQLPEEKERENKASDNIWNRVNPAEKAYPGEYAPAWGWVLTDWGD